MMIMDANPQIPNVPDAKLKNQNELLGKKSIRTARAPHNAPINRECHHFNDFLFVAFFIKTSTFELGDTKATSFEGVFITKL